MIPCLVCVYTMAETAGFNRLRKTTMSPLTRPVHEDQIQHELKHQEPYEPDNSDVEQGRVFASRGIGVDDNGSSQSNDENDPVSDGGKDAPFGGKFLPPVETKPFLDKAHVRLFGFTYLTQSLFGHIDA